MYKFTSGILLIGLFILGGFFGVERCNHAEARKKYNNAMVEFEGLKQETETAKSIRALLEEDLEAKDKELQDVIEDRDERILAQAEVTVKLKDKLLKAENAKETIIKDGKTIVITKEGATCDDTLRYKVEFEIEEKPMKVVGFTLTNPPHAELKLIWVEDLRLELNLTKDEDDNFRVYSDSGDFQVKDIVLKVDPEILESRWYERISFGSDLAAGEFGAQLGLRPGYDVLNNLNVNLLFVLQYDGANAKTFYGAGITWYPWK